MSSAELVPSTVASGSTEVAPPSLSDPSVSLEQFVEHLGFVVVGQEVASGRPNVKVAAGKASTILRAAESGALRSSSACQQVTEHRATNEMRAVGRRLWVGSSCRGSACAQ